MKLRFVALSLALVLLPGLAHAQTGELIRTFDVQARVQNNRRLDVTETIRYDFGDAERHGIYREIPVKYERNGGNYNLRLTVDDVLMDGKDVEYDTSRDDGNLRIKIGDADTTITGPHTYQISYHTDRAINFFDGEGELYWNVTGNEWQVPINQTSFAVTGPEGFNAASAQTVCYTGPFGSTEQDCTISGSGAQVVVTNKQPLSSYEGVTVAVRFAKGLIVEPTIAERIWQVVRDNGVLALPFLTLAFMLWLWNKKGRDPKGKGTVVPQYEAPHHMTPGEIIGLKEQDVPNRAITATILDLARRGHLQIEFGEEKKLLSTKQTYTFHKMPNGKDPLDAADAEVMSGLFTSGTTSDMEDLKGSFYKHITPFKNAIFSSLKSKGFFNASPIAVRGLYLGVAVAVAVATFWLLAAFLSGLAVVAIIVSAAIIGIIGWFMPSVTKAGAVALEEVEGFKWFLSVTEKDRLAFHNAPEVKPSMFHEFLPAAVVFGVEEKWAEQFKGLEIPPPSYATGSVLHHWSVMNFAHDIGRMNTAAASSAYVNPSSAGSGGSGFSGGGGGGGFGGGGGGSW